VDLPPADSRYESLTIDDEGFIRLLWPVGAKITGPSAQQAFDEVNE
jgi:hypothetical protein